jgi:serine/threonine protein kinase
MFRENSQIGPYILIRRLGRGGFGEVWLAERRTKFVTTKVAIKLPLHDQIDTEKIRQEAMLWEQASGHPNVLPIIDADEYDGQIVIVSEYAPDGSLEQFLKEKGPMDIGQALYTAIDILNGLEFLHSRGIIHRDVKPANMLLQGETARLSDFGISRAIRTSVSSESQNVSGTFAYMAPEAFDGKRSIQTDIWSVGVNLYRFLTGNYPYREKEPTALIAAIMMNKPQPLPDNVPADVRRIIAKAMAKKPEDRYGLAREMRDDLRRVAVEKFDRRSMPRTDASAASAAVVAPDYNSEETVITKRRQSKPGDEIGKDWVIKDSSGRFAWITIAVLLLGGVIFSIFYFGATPATPNSNSQAQQNAPANKNGTANVSGDSRSSSALQSAGKNNKDNEPTENGSESQPGREPNRPDLSSSRETKNSAKPAAQNKDISIGEPDIRQRGSEDYSEPYISTRPANSQHNKPANANRP